jgi:2-dehydro-3-deoxygalactonokinase
VPLTAATRAPLSSTSDRVPDPRTTALLAIDWGTTSARAYRMSGDGEVLAVREAPLGVQPIAGGDFGGALRALLGDWIDVAAPRIACGMIGSRQGWIEVPYVSCPAALDALAQGIAGTPGGELAIVPGVTCRDPAGVPDVMRGEETQLAGAIEPGTGDALAVLPGTHSKWARVEGGRLADFATYMTGEIYGALMAHTILGRLATAGRDADAPPGPAFVRGLERGIGSGGLLHDLFGARTLALAGELDPAEVADWLSGLLIGREVRSARIAAQRAGHDASRVILVGAQALVARYERALLHLDIVAVRGPLHAAARGLWRIARRAGMIPR